MLQLAEQKNKKNQKPRVEAEKNSEGRKARQIKTSELFHNDRKKY